MCRGATSKVAWRVCTSAGFSSSIAITRSTSPFSIARNRSSAGGASRMPLLVSRRFCSSSSMTRTISVVAALGGDGVGGRRIAVGIDAVARVGAVGHQDAHDVRCVLEHGIVQHLKVGVRHPRQLRTCVQHRSHVVHIPRAHCVYESLHRGTVDERLELRPAFKPVARAPARAARRGARTSQDRRRDNAP